MSKHQTCKTCSRAFVGPDLDIGENNCSECDEDIHQDCIELSNKYDTLLAYVKENAKIPANVKAIKVLEEIGEEL